MSTKNRDPRRPDAVVKFVPPVLSEEDSDVDWPGFIALLVGIFGVFKKNKYASWIALFLSLSSVCTAKKSEAAGRMGGAIFFAISSLLVVYSNELYFSRLMD